MAELKVIAVSKTLDNLHTLDNISLHVGNNEFVVILGPSGCGKSTLLNIISGLISPDHGQVQIDDENWTGRTGRISYMQQKDLLLPSRDILDNVSIPLILKGINKRKARETAGKYLKDFGLEEFPHHYPRQLSGGMRQRAALLRTYLFSSDILLLDEPFASLDAITRRNMHLWLKDLRRHYQPSILFVTHDIEEALLLADRIYVLSARPAAVKLEIDMTIVNTDTDLQEDIKNQILTILEKETSKAEE